jgi:hypothetical protein
MVSKAKEDIPRGAGVRTAITRRALGTMCTIASGALPHIGDTDGMYTYILIIALLPAAAYAQFDQADWASDVNPNLSKNMMADDYKVLDGGKDTAESTKYLESLCPSCKADIDNDLIGHNGK